jgi:lysophospholipase L1-like esterase
MHSRYVPRRGAIRAGAAAALLALAACGDDPDLIVPDPVQADAGAMFNSYVALGNSITAGFQSDGINDSTQQESYARLLADQLGTRYEYAELRMPGCQPPIANPLTGARVGTTATVNTAGTCSLLLEPAGGPINNVAIPGAASEDPTARTSIASNTITTLILNGQTQVERALDADPTFVTVWIGNNDVLQAAASGMLAPTAGVSRGITDTSTFKLNYRAMLKQLTDSAPALEGALIGVVNTASIPLLFPVGILLQSPQAYAAFTQATGGNPATPATSLPIHPNCGTAAAPANYLVSFAIAARIAAYRAAGSPAVPPAGTHPALISCGNAVGTPAAGTAVGDIFMLSATEQATLLAAVNSYNTFIKARADSLGWAYVDVNPTLLNAKAADVAAADPRITTFPRLDLALLNPPRSPFGRWISFDGVHPSGEAHVEIANLVIAAINAKYGTTITPCTLAPRVAGQGPNCQ